MTYEITAKELKKKIDLKEKFILLDVRTKEEIEIAKIKNSVWIPLSELENRFLELDKTKEIIVYCHHGSRSLAAAKFLSSKGYNAKSLAGGIDLWSCEIDSAVPTY